MLFLSDMLGDQSLCCSMSVSASVTTLVCSLMFSGYACASVAISAWCSCASATISASQSASECAYRTKGFWDNSSNSKNNVAFNIS